MGKNDVKSNLVSSLNIRANVADQRRTFNSLWGKVHKAPLFQKASSKGDRTYQSRFASSHAYRTLASAAAKHVADMVDRDAKHLRSSVAEEKARAPAMVTLGKGSVTFLEQVLCAYVQTVLARSEKIRKATKTSLKPSRETIELVAKWLNTDIASFSGFAVHTGVTPHLKKKPSKKAGAKFVEEEATQA